MFRAVQVTNDSHYLRKILICSLTRLCPFQVIMATNRIETLDPALIRPGRIDRKIEFPLPDEKTKRRIFTIHTSRMTLAEDVNIDDYVMSKDDLSGADIKVSVMMICDIFMKYCHSINNRLCGHMKNHACLCK